MSSVEDPVHFSPGYSDPFPGFGRMFFQLGYLLARQEGNTQGVLGEVGAAC